MEYKENALLYTAPNEWEITEGLVVKFYPPSIKKVQQTQDVYKRGRQGLDIEALTLEIVSLRAELEGSDEMIREVLLAQVENIERMIVEAQNGVVDATGNLLMQEAAILIINWSEIEDRMTDVCSIADLRYILALIHATAQTSMAIQEFDKAMELVKQSVDDEELKKKIAPERDSNVEIDSASCLALLVNRGYSEEEIINWPMPVFHCRLERVIHQVAVELDKERQLAMVAGNIPSEDDKVKFEWSPLCLIEKSSGGGDDKLRREIEEYRKSRLL